MQIPINYKEFALPAPLAFTRHITVQCPKWGIMQKEDIPGSECQVPLENQIIEGKGNWAI